MRFIFLVIKKSLYSILGLFLILTGILAFLVSSTPGLFLTVKLVNNFLPGELHVTEIQGKVANHVSLRQLTWSDKNLQLKISNLDLHWRLRDLFRRKLTIKNIQAEDVELVTLKNPEAKQPAAKLSGFPQLPVDIIIDNMQINQLNIRVDNTVTQFQKVMLQTHLTNQQWDIHHFDLRYHHHKIQLKALAHATFPYQTHASLRIDKPKTKEPGVDGQLTLRGNFFDYHLSGTLKQPTILKLQGSFKNGHELHAFAKWQQLNWPFNENYSLRMEKGQLLVDGTIPQLKIHLTTEQSLPVVAKIDLKAQTLPDNKVNTQVSILSPLGSLQLDAAYDKGLTPRIAGKFTAKMSKEPISPLISDAIVSGQFKGDSLVNLSLNSQITALYQMSRLNGAINYQHQELKTEITLGSNHIKLTGKPNSPWTVTASLPEPALLHPSLKDLKTIISAEGHLDNPQKGSLLVKINKGHYELPEKSGLPFEGGELRASLDNKQLQATGNFILDNNKILNMTIKLPEFHYANLSTITQKIIGNIRLNINSLAFINDLSPEISNAQGQLHAELNITGTLAKPSLIGKLDLTKSSVNLPKMGINLNPVQLSIQSQDKKWEARGALVSGNSTLAIHGVGDFFPIFNGKISLNAVDFPVMNTTEYAINLSPKIDLEIAPSVVKIKGTVLVPKAQIKPQTFTDTVSLSDDVVFVSDAPPPANPLNLDTDISINMGNEVALDIKGLHGFLTGGIHLRQFPGRQLTASGELNIRDGKYTAYGQDLTIQQGQLLFTGGQVENPGIRVRAVRKFKNAANSFAGSNQLFDFKSDNIQTLDLGNKTTAGIEVSGRLTEPKIKLFSIPSNLSQADILSLLLLGKPASQASESGGQLLLTAVSALNLGSGAGGTQLLGQLKQNLGIDFNLQNNPQYNQKTNQSTNSTAFVVGKSLSKRLYLSYNMGLSSTDNNMLTLKYLLNKFLSLQVNASMTASGVDLLYTHKKD